MIRLSNEQYTELIELLGHDPQIDGEWSIVPNKGPVIYTINSKGTIVVRLSCIDNAGRRQRPRLLHIGEFPDHYLFCTIDNKEVRLHRLMAQTWLDDYDDRLTVNHKDGNTYNNDISNLEMMSVRDNCLHYHHSDVMKEHREQDYSYHSTTMKGRIHITNGQKSKMIYESEGIPEGWYKGRSESMKRKVSGSRKGQSSPNKNKRTITNGIHNKYISDSEPLPQGWRFGATITLSEKAKQVRREFMKGRIYVHQGTINKRILPEELSQYLSQGWVKGMYSKRSKNL